MKKLKINNAKWTIKLIASFIVVLSLFVNYQLSIVNSVYAQESSPSGTLLQKLNQLKSEIASKAAEIKNDISKKIQDKAVFGSIVKIEDEQIIIRGVNGDKTVKYDEFTEILGIADKKIKVTTLEEGDQIAALGDVDDKNNLAAKRLVFLESASWRIASQSGILVWGQITKTNGQTIHLKDKSGENQIILTNNQTVFFLGNNEAGIQDARAEKFMAIRGTRLKDGSIRAGFVYFIPSVGFIKPSQKTASPSANTTKTQ